MACEELFAVESPQLLWPTGPDGVNILAAAKVCRVEQYENRTCSKKTKTRTLLYIRMLQYLKIKVDIGKNNWLGFHIDWYH